MAVLDLEAARWGLDDPEGLTVWALRWLEHVADQTGVPPVLYTGPGFWSAHMGRTLAIRPYRLWVAAYPSRAPAADAKPAHLGPMAPWAWQYTGRGVVPGLTGRFDLNRLYGPRPDSPAF